MNVWQKDKNINAHQLCITETRKTEIGNSETEAKQTEEAKVNNSTISMHEGCNHYRKVIQ